MYTARRRGPATRIGIMVAVIGGLAAMVAPGASAATPLAAPAASVSQTKCVTTGVSSTCTGSYSGINAYDPWAASPDTTISHPPVVTVSQTKNLTDQVVDVHWQYFTPTLTSNTSADPGAPNPVGDALSYEVNIFECKGTNPVWNDNGLADDCYEFPLGGSVQAPDGPANALMESPTVGGITYAPQATGVPGSWGGPATTTGGDPSTWQGQAQIHIEAGTEENSFLGCDVHAPCSLVVVPNWGGNYSINNEGAGVQGPEGTADCGDHSYDSYASSFPPTSANAVHGFACETQNRIIVPLSFAPTPANCPQKNPAFYAEGSPMMSRQLTQWQTAWCTGPAPVSLQFTRNSEEIARGAFLQGGQSLGARIDMALTTLPATKVQVTASSRRFTYAPLANSGTAIAYYLDDAQTGQQINHLVLNARLAAKLTTLSYSLVYNCQNQPQSPWPALPAASNTCDPAVTHQSGGKLVANPSTLYDDPEFLALNKKCQPAHEPAGYTCGRADFPADAAGDTDYGTFLPTVLQGDSDMTYQLTDWIEASAAAAAYLRGTADPSGMQVNTHYQGVTYPTQAFQELDPGTKYPLPLQCTPSDGCPAAGTWDATMNVTWNFVTDLDHVVASMLLLQPNAQTPQLACELGTGACTAPSELGPAAFPPESPGSRSLLSEMDLGDTEAYQFPAAAIVNADGKAVAPSQASVDAAVKDMVTNADGITQHVNQSSKDPAAYPLAMVDYAMVPTCGLSHTEASAIADFLTKAATTGQKQGVSPGELGPGYYPLTSAQRAQTVKAAQEVRAQKCPANPGSGGKHSGTPGSGQTSPGGAHPGSTPGAHPAGSTPGGYNTAAYGQKSADSGLSGTLLAVLLVAQLSVLLLGLAVWVLVATGRLPALRRHLPGWLARRA